MRKQIKEEKIKSTFSTWSENDINLINKSECWNTYFSVSIIVPQKLQVKTPEKD